MGYAERHSVTLTTDSNGDVTGYTDVVSGRIVTVRYVKDDFADGVDFVVTSEDSTQAIWSQLNVDASQTVAPRQATHSVAGVASLYAGSGEPVEDHIVVANERIKIVVDEGGDTKSGTVIIIVE